MEIKIFENGTIQEELARALKWCKRTGGHIATVKEAYDLREQGKVPNKWYSTSTVFYKGRVRKATQKELENIEDFYDKGGRVLFLSIIIFNGLYGINILYNNGRYIGVKE